MMLRKQISQIKSFGGRGASTFSVSVRSLGRLARMGDYFFTRLVWLATHCHLAFSSIHVSVKRPKCSYGLP
jgi:hypothetical protein